MSCFGFCGSDDFRKTADTGPMPPHNPAGYSGGHYQRAVPPMNQPVIQMQPIFVPAIPVDELKDITDNYGSKALIGEGSYGRVFYGVLKSSGAAAIKKLDTSEQPGQEFLSQAYRVETKDVKAAKDAIKRFCVLSQARPMVSKEKVKQCVDARLLGEYPRKAVTKLAVVAAYCVQYEPKLRPDMSIVVKALLTLQDST